MARLRKSAAETPAVADIPHFSDDQLRLIKDAAAHFMSATLSDSHGRRDSVLDAFGDGQLLGSLVRTHITHARPTEGEVLALKMAALMTFALNDPTAAGRIAPQLRQPSARNAMQSATSKATVTFAILNGVWSAADYWSATSDFVASLHSIPDPAVERAVQALADTAGVPKSADLERLRPGLRTAIGWASMAIAGVPSTRRGVAVIPAEWPSTRAVQGALVELNAAITSLLPTFTSVLAQSNNLVSLKLPIELPGLTPLDADGLV